MLGEALAGQDTWRAAFQDVPLQTRAELLATFLVPGAFGLLFYGMFLRSRHESFGIIPGVREPAAPGSASVGAARRTWHLTRDRPPRAPQGAFALTLALSLNMLVLAIMEVVSERSRRRLCCARTPRGAQHPPAARRLPVTPSQAGTRSRSGSRSGGST